MSALKSILAASALVVGLVASAEAQGVVPGGWAPQVGYQQFGTIGAYSGGMVTDGSPLGGGGFYGGFGTFGGGMVPYGAGQLMTTTPVGLPLYGYTGVGPVVPQTTIATDPLIGAIRQSTRRSNRR